MSLDANLLDSLNQALGLAQLLDQLQALRRRRDAVQRRNNTHSQDLLQVEAQIDQIESQLRNRTVAAKASITELERGLEEERRSALQRGGR